MRLLKPTFIDPHCYASAFSGLLSILPSNAVNADSLSTVKLWVIDADTKKATPAPPLCLFWIFWTQLQRFFCGIVNQIVKPLCFVCRLFASKQIKSMSRVFLARQTNIYKKILETWRNWVSKLNSRLSFYNRLPAVEKCLDKKILDRYFH